jgi:hypothetical protein
MNRSENSLPEKLPSTNHVQSAFDEWFGYESIGAADDERMRIELLRERLVPEFVFIAARLHLTLTRQHANNHHTLSGDSTIIGALSGPDTYIRHGMDRFDVFVPCVLPAVEAAIDQICESDIPDDKKLRRMGIVAGAAIAESQTFSDGNTRIARAVHDYIVHGRAGVSVDAIYDNTRNFALSEAVEEIILEQNTSRLITGTIDTVPHPLSAVRVPEYITPWLRDARETLDGMYARLPMYRTGMGKVASIATARTTDIEGGLQLARTLLQDSYGPASYLVAFADQDVLPDFPMNATDIQNIITADRRLNAMRVMSIIGGAVNGGRFMSIRDASDNPLGRTIEKHDWAPSIVA